MKFLGTRIGVGRTVYLDRPVSDHEWDLLVVDLRETFNARGKLRQEGSFRQWTNGNLQVLLEPTDSGERLRLKTVKSGARASILMGGTVLTLFALYAAGILMGGEAAGFVTLGIAWLVGASFFGRYWFRLSRWADTGERQMEDVSRRLVAALSAADRADETGKD